MIFSNDTKTDKFRIVLGKIKRTRQGGLKIEASDPLVPKEKPGYITITSSEIKRIKKLLLED